MDLTRVWSYPDSSFDTVMMTWVLHWLGREHKFAIREMVRVMKPNAIGFIATLSPYDVLIKDQVFPKTVSFDELQKIFSEADKITEGVSLQNKWPIWIVHLDSFIFRELQKNSDIVIVEKHPLSSIGRKTLAGFNPSYITSLLETAGCTVILQYGSRNTNFPNGYIEGDRTNTLLYYVFRKSK